jgi:WD40 repeat protein
VAGQCLRVSYDCLNRDMCSLSDGVVIRWDTQSGLTHRVLRGHSDRIVNLVFGSALATGRRVPCPPKKCCQTNVKEGKVFR